MVQVKHQLIASRLQNGALFAVQRKHPAGPSNSFPRRQVSDLTTNPEEWRAHVLETAHYGAEVAGLWHCVVIDKVDDGRRGTTNSCISLHRQAGRRSHVFDVHSSITNHLFHDMFRLVGVT